MMKTRVFAGAIVLVQLAVFQTIASALPERFMRVDSGLYRGAQPGTAEDFDYLKSLGIRTVINLRKYLRWQEPDYRAWVESLGFRYFNAPVPTVTVPETVKIHALLKDLRDTSLKPIYVHCMKGRDRTGLVMALYRVKAQGWSPARAYKEWREMGFKKTNVGLLPFFEQETGWEAP